MVSSVIFLVIKLFIFKLFILLRLFGRDVRRAFGCPRTEYADGYA